MEFHSLIRKFSMEMAQFNSTENDILSSSINKPCFNVQKYLYSNMNIWSPSRRATYLLVCLSIKLNHLMRYFQCTKSLCWHRKFMQFRDGQLYFFLHSIQLVDFIIQYECVLVFTFTEMIHCHSRCVSSNSIIHWHLGDYKFPIYSETLMFAHAKCAMHIVHCSLLNISKLFANNMIMYTN